ncbi:MAG: DUF697 domain-containing protein [Pirellulaceae bacterium]|nr:DUF697 domain-containing protein [Pirellulaceae bacterium]
MQLGKAFSGVILLIAAAVVGLVLLYLPGWIVDKYQTLSSLSPFWGIVYLVVVSIGGVLFFGSLIWTVWRLWRSSRGKQKSRELHSKNPSELSLNQQASEIDENLERLNQLQTKDAKDGRLQAELDPLVQAFNEKRETLTLEIIAFGTISSGKSSVLNLLAGREAFATDVRGGTTVTRNQVEWEHFDKVFLVDTPGLGEIDGEKHVWIAADAAKGADLILLVVDGPLRESEFRLLEKLGHMEKRIVVCLNKSDWYHAEDRAKLLSQLRSQTSQWVDADDVVAIQALENSRIRRRTKPDGTQIEETVAVPPEIDGLAGRMMAIVKQDRKELVMANLLLQSRGLLEKARQQIKQSLDERAWNLVERYMWGSASVAAVSPFPLVDLAAGAGISTKMIMDLAENYGHKIDMQTALKWLGEMGKILVSVLGSQGASMAAGAIFASMIQAVPIAGQLVGNAVQGVIQAIITRWIGAVFIEYFGNEMTFVDGGLANTARREWDKVMELDSLRKLVNQAREKFSGK